MMDARTTLARLAVVATVFHPASPASAVDGVVEINQTCAIGTGCLAGDPAGFPVRIEAAGSYRLTSDLDLSGEPVPQDATAIQILLSAEGTTLDLNGFSITGVVSCAGTPPTCNPSGGTGIGVNAAASLVRVSGGAIRGMGSDGVKVQGFDSQVEDVRLQSNGGVCVSGSQGTLIRGLSVRLCGGHGIAAGFGSLVEGNTVAFSGGLGLALDATSGYARNVLRGNNGGSSPAVPQVQGGREVGPNVCNGVLCSPAERLFYLTVTSSEGNGALGACAPGYHMASFWEIHDTSQLRYNADLGLTRADSGSGPASGAPGWVRTGWFSGTSTTPGVGNCAAWTSNDLAHSGTTAALGGLDWSSPAQHGSPWRASTAACGFTGPGGIQPPRVWCVED